MKKAKWLVPLFLVAAVGIAGDAPRVDVAVEYKRFEDLVAHGNSVYNFMFDTKESSQIIRCLEARNIARNGGISALWKEIDEQGDVLVGLGVFSQKEKGQALASLKKKLDFIGRGTIGYDVEVSLKCGLKYPELMTAKLKES